MKTEIAKVTMNWSSACLDCDVVMDILVGGRWDQPTEEERREYGVDKLFSLKFVLAASVNEEESGGEWSRSEREEVRQEVESTFVAKVLEDEDYGEKFIQKVEDV